MQMRYNMIKYYYY